jgi:hypothetical protein
MWVIFVFAERAPAEQAHLHFGIPQSFMHRREQWYGSQNPLSFAPKRCG